MHIHMLHWQRGTIASCCSLCSITAALLTVTAAAHKIGQRQSVGGAVIRDNLIVHYAWGQVLSSLGRELLDWGRSRHAQWLGYLSSTSVYGDWGGSWVNEGCGASWMHPCGNCLVTAQIGPCKAASFFCDIMISAVARVP